MRKYVIAAGTDDAFNYADTPDNSYLASPNVRFGHRSGVGKGDCTGGFRFLPDLPKALNIILALMYMSLGSDDLVGTMRVKIAADDVDNSPTFNDSDQEPRDRVLTTAQVDWDEDTWLQDTWKFSPDIKAVIQEIYARGGFAPGNGLSAILTNDGSDADANASVISEDEGGGYEAELWLWTNETETDDDVATRMGIQKKCFYANGRFWMFYCHDEHIYYRTSTDGINWALEIELEATGIGAYFSVWFNGTYVHCARNVFGGGPIYYRRGTPNADGSITWSAESDTGTTGNDPCIIVDDQGYPWIFYLGHDGVGYEPWVTKSDTNDGTWSTQAAFPFKLSADGDDVLRCFGVPLTGGKVFAIWGWPNAQAKGRVWTGAAWDAEETITLSNLFNYATKGPGISAVNEGDDVHLVFRDTTPDILYRKRAYGVGWGAEGTVQAAVSATSEPVVSRTGTTLYCFWAGSPAADHIYYKKQIAGVWDAAPTDWIDESADDLTGNQRLTCSYLDYGNYIILMYMALIASPYQVRLNFISTLAPPTGIQDKSAHMAAKMVAGKLI